MQIKCRDCILQCEDPTDLAIVKSMEDHGQTPRNSGISQAGRYFPCLRPSHTTHETAKSAAIFNTHYNFFTTATIFFVQKNLCSFVYSVQGPLEYLVAAVKMIQYCCKYKTPAFELKVLSFPKKVNRLLPIASINK